jgi:hypothetical protein
MPSKSSADEALCSRFSALALSCSPSGGASPLPLQPLPLPPLPLLLLLLLLLVLLLPPAAVVMCGVMWCASTEQGSVGVSVLQQAYGVATLKELGVPREHHCIKQA